MRIIWIFVFTNLLFIQTKPIPKNGFKNIALAPINLLKVAMFKPSATQENITFQTNLEKESQSKTEIENKFSNEINSDPENPQNIHHTRSESIKLMIGDDSGPVLSEDVKKKHENDQDNSDLDRIFEKISRISKDSDDTFQDYRDDFDTNEELKKKEMEEKTQNEAEKFIDNFDIGAAAASVHKDTGEIVRRYH